METNEYETNQLDSDVLLPPRKRLLAGLKRQSSESPPQSSVDNSNSSSSTEFDTRLQNLLKSHPNGPQMSSEEIAEAAESAALAATKLASAARAAAEEKAAVAAKAVAAAKTALSLVSSFSNKDRHSKKHKTKTKKCVSVENLYKEGNEDQELARKLHQAINSSSRIVKPRLLVQYENDRDSEGSSEQLAEIRVEGDSMMFESSSDGNGLHTNVRKKGRVKQKKLSLSLL